MITYLSANQRSEAIQQLQATHFDLLVIGGGITGAGIAIDAATRGMRVALVEKNDFASGTSSKSTKLVHGGLRYLKQMEIQLVREVGTERAIVHHLAPHLVRAEKMLLPLIKGGTYGKTATSLGLMVYDLLAKVLPEDRRKMLNVDSTKTAEPLLVRDDLTGGGLYAEYRTDDARLTMELIKTAANHGAIALNYVEAMEFKYDQEGKVQGIEAKDHLSEQIFSIAADYTVSAAGPWVDELRDINHSLKGKHLFHSKGVHIVVPHQRLPLQQSVYFDVPDGRMMFAIPRNRVTYLGTTDTEYKGDLDHVVANVEDVDYILKGVNSMFPTAKLGMDDVESSWAGLRPLIHEEGKSPSEMSRKDEIFESDNGLISIAGGKLTGYRKMAERIVDLVARKYRKQHQRTFGSCKTAETVLTGGPFEDQKAVFEFEDQVAEALSSRGLGYDQARYLVSNYGKQAIELLPSIDQHLANHKPEEAMALAEWEHCVRHELCFTLLDFFNRRTGRLYFDLPSIDPCRRVIVQAFSNHFNWSSERQQAEELTLDQAIQDCSEFIPFAMAGDTK
ncbi:MAG: glycerol-3-phosphate dehydrogenase/oxidase [Bacteroidota bacterium]